MSPFQLQCCTYFHEVMRAYSFAEERLDVWEETLKETKQWRIAWVHGKARLSHYIPPYWISWERAHWNSPLFDVIAALRFHVQTMPPLGREWLEGIGGVREGAAAVRRGAGGFYTAIWRSRVGLSAVWSGMRPLRGTSGTNGNMWPRCSVVIWRSKIWRRSLCTLSNATPRGSRKKRWTTNRRRMKAAMVKWILNAAQTKWRPTKSIPNGAPRQ